MRSIGVLLVRLTVGGLLAGHGAQKLFGAFGGQGMRGTSGWFESMRLRPAPVWARLAGASELGGGLLTALGFLNPLGPIAAAGSMLMAWAKVHVGRPVWVTAGGAELPLTNLAVLSAIALAGPGRLSIDGLLGIRVPRRLGLLALAGVGAGLWVGARSEVERAAGQVERAAGQVERAAGQVERAAAQVAAALGPAEAAQPAGSQAGAGSRATATHPDAPVLDAGLDPDPDRDLVSIAAITEHAPHAAEGEGRGSS